MTLSTTDEPPWDPNDLPSATHDPDQLESDIDA